MVGVGVKPEPSDGPDFHVELAAWERRQPELMSLDEFLERYWDAPSEPSVWQVDMLKHALRGRNLIYNGGRQVGRSTVARAITRMLADL